MAIQVDNIGCEELLITVTSARGGLHRYFWIPGGNYRQWGQTTPSGSAPDRRSLRQALKRTHQ